VSHSSLNEVWEKNKKCKFKVHFLIGQKGQTIVDISLIATAMLKPALPLGPPRADSHVDEQKSYVQQALAPILRHKISTSD
jgi:hypothetical protein